MALRIAADRAAVAPEDGFVYSPGPSETPARSPVVKKAKPLPHRNRAKSARANAKRKAKHKRVRLRKSKGERSTYR